MRKSASIATVVGTVAALAGVAMASHSHLRGVEAARAALVAIKVSGGAWATPGPSFERGVSWTFHVMRNDGSHASVLLNRRLQVVAIREVPIAQVASNETARGDRSDSDESESRDDADDGSEGADDGSDDADDEREANERPDDSNEKSDDANEKSDDGEDSD